MITRRFCCVNDRVNLLCRGKGSGFVRHVLPGPLKNFIDGLASIKFTDTVVMSMNIVNDNDNDSDPDKPEPKALTTEEGMRKTIKFDLPQIGSF